MNVGYVNSAGDLRFNAGLFAGHSIDGTFDNESWIAAARAVYSPLLGGNQFHFGANFQHRKFQSNNNGTTASASGQPSTNQLARYRARPFTQTTDVRFVDTGNFAAKSDDIFGLEFGGIFKSLHVAAEGQYLNSNAYGAGDTLGNMSGSNTINLFPGSLATVLVPDGDPSFWGGYIEAGYFFTGETRGYKNGTWDRTKVLKPFSKGGWGAVQLNGRVDYLDLDSSKLKSAFNNNFITGVASASNDATRGGKQLGLLASVVWIPEDWMRFYFQYSHAFVTGGPFADEVSGLAELGSEPRRLRLRRRLRRHPCADRLLASFPLHSPERKAGPLARMYGEGAFFLSLGRIDRPRTMLLVERDEGEQAFGDLHLGSATVAAGDDFDANAHRSAADALYLGIDGDDISQVDRRDELHALDRNGRDWALGPPRGGDAAGDVHLA